MERRLRSLTTIANHWCDRCGRPAATIEPSQFSYTLMCGDAACLYGAAGSTVNTDGAMKRKELVMNMGKYASTSFVKYDDVKAGPQRKTIVAIGDGAFNKPLLTFDDGSKLGLNRTNVRTLMNAFGAESNDWLGKAVELYAGVLEYQGKQHDSVLINAAV